MRDFALIRTSLAHSWLITFSQGEPVLDLRAILARENDRSDCIRALHQPPRYEQAWDAPQQLAAKQPRIKQASAGSAFSSRSPISTDIGQILRIGPLQAKPAVLSQLEKRASRWPLLWKLFLQLLVNERGLDEATYKRVFGFVDAPSQP